MNLSTDVAMHRARQFLREMAQPAPGSGVSLSLEQLQRNASYVAHAPGEGAAAVAFQPDSWRGRGAEGPSVGGVVPMEICA